MSSSAATRRDSAAQREQLLRDRDHLAGAFHLVVGRLHAQLDLIRNPREVLLGLRELRLAFAHDGSLPTALEQIDARANSDRAEAVGQERHIVLKAVAREHVYIRDEVVLRETDGGSGFFDLRARFGDLRMRVERLANASFPFAPLGGPANR